MPRFFKLLPCRSVSHWAIGYLSPGLYQPIARLEARRREWGEVNAKNIILTHSAASLTPAACPLVQ